MTINKPYEALAFHYDWDIDMFDSIKRNPETDKLNDIISIHLMVIYSCVKYHWLDKNETTINKRNSSL